ncbi:MAG: ABC transporter ATP-binding protein [Archangium gephyra]|uniref:ABC transporter ATP-binding protein n=1 Tax=Archangium gephyra TaxID=48 RepID=A0A2W5SQG0_9BACT|nr:MAG: ABC transporter ATP-binding protein [Archangium gephyra]
MPVPLSQLAMKLFVKSHPDAPPGVPGLVWEAPPAANATEATPWDVTSAGQASSRPTSIDPLIFLVEKGTSTNNPFAMGVTVGRVESNDLVVDDGSVSRFHAWLQQDDRSGDWSLTDAESKNGTWVDGAQLSARQRVVLKDGATLKFGDVVMRFFLPEALKTFVGDRYKSKR